ncbi:MAG: hypothetical protein RSD36_12115 [Terrisporobacter sp.]
MKKLSKAFYTIATVLQFALLLGIYVVNYFTRKKMGMARFVSAKNYVWENTYPIEKIQYISIIILVILTILAMLFYIKRRSKNNKKIRNVNILMVVLVSIYSVFNLLYSTYDYRAFYFMGSMLGAATFIQIIKSFLIKD